MNRDIRGKLPVPKKKDLGIVVNIKKMLPLVREVFIVCLAHIGSQLHSKDE